MEHFKNVSQRHKQQLERAEQVYQQRQAELEQYAERLKGEAEMSKADLIDKAQLVAVEKLSLEEQLAKVNAEFKLKEKQLETTIADKSRLSDEVLAKTQQVRQYRKQIDSYTRELQNFREQNTKMEEDHLHHVCSVYIQTVGVMFRLVAVLKKKKLTVSSLMCSLAVSAPERVARASGQLRTDDLSQRNLISDMSYLTCNESHYA